jgi:hypothetical protein
MVRPGTSSRWARKTAARTRSSWAAGIRGIPSRMVLNSGLVSRAPELSHRGFLVLAIPL